jgi:hypothetical protein
VSPLVLAVAGEYGRTSIEQLAVLGETELELGMRRPTVPKRKSFGG